MRRNETNNPLLPPKLCYSVRRVATLLDMSVDWVKKQVAMGELPGYRLGNQVMVRADALDEFLRNRSV
jgi:excisionase family DNA binding protein